MIIRRTAAGLASAAVALALFGAGSASAEPMKHWSTDCGVTIAVSEAKTHNPMQPRSCHEHGPVAPKTADGVVIDSAGQ